MNIVRNRFHWPAWALVVLACSPASSTTSDGTTTDDATATTDGATATADSGSATSGQTGPSDETGPPPPIDAACNDAQPVPQFDGTPSGWVACDDGVIHRVDAVACSVPSELPPSKCLIDEPCTSDAECTEQSNGFCLDDPAYDVGCGCVYACESDTDCAAGELCLCAASYAGIDVPVPVCVAVGCAADADCGDGLCALDRTVDLCNGVHFETGCLGPGSECRSDSCPDFECEFDGSQNPGLCKVVSDEWTCLPPLCGPSGCG